MKRKFGAMGATKFPTVFSIMLRSPGASHFTPLGHVPLLTAPVPGAPLAFTHDGRSLHGVVDQVFIPPGCDENCIGTVFVTGT